MRLTDLKLLTRRLLLALGGIAVGTLLSAPFEARITRALLVPVPAGTQLYTTLGWTLPAKGAFYGGLFLAAPWVLWQLVKLLAPERFPPRAAFAVVLCATALFYGGAAFAHAVVVPPAVAGALSVTLDGLQPMVQVDWVIAMTVRTMVACGLAFELPLVAVLLVVISRTQKRLQGGTSW